MWQGVDIGDRAAVQAKAWTNHNNDFVSLFYDGHNCFTSLLAGDRKVGAFFTLTKTKTTFIFVIFFYHIYVV